MQGFRLLVISHNSFSNHCNNGKTLEAILSKFDKNSLSQLFFHSLDRPDFDFCHNYFRISDFDIIKSYIHNNKVGARINKEEGQPINIKGGNCISFMYNFASCFFNTHLRDLLWRSVKWSREALFNWISNFGPDAVFFVGGEAEFSTRLAIEISSYFKLPLVTFYTDDYLLFPIHNNLLPSFKKQRLEKLYNDTVSNSAKVYVIGEYMAEEYKKHFGRNFSYIMNSVAVSKYVPYVRHKVLTFSYFGGLHLGRWRMLIRLRRILPSDIIFFVYGSGMSKMKLRMFRKYGLLYGGILDQNEMKLKILESDMLVHVESDKRRLRCLTKLSISTKIPEYMISGRPILGYGPPDQASMKMLRDNNLGFVFDSTNDIVENNEKLCKIIDNYELRRQMGINGYHYAVSHYNNDKIAQEFYDEMITIATGKI